MLFEEVLPAIRSGFSVSREGWNGNGLSVKMQVPDEFSKMNLPYLYIEYPEDHPTTPSARCPWLASQTDILANDWVIV